METVIIICLLIIIVLLLQDKIIIQSGKKIKNEKVNHDLPDIMGQPRVLKGHLKLDRTAKRWNELIANGEHNLDIEYDPNEIVSTINVNQDQDKLYSNIPDLEEEEEEWDELLRGENGFASGVTFDELSTVSELLQKENLLPELEQKAVDIVLKIQGTELFSLLESSMEGTSQKLAALLDKTLSMNTESGSSSPQNELNDFDIGNFI